MKLFSIIPNMILFKFERRSVKIELFEIFIRSIKTIIIVSTVAKLLWIVYKEYRKSRVPCPHQ